jgi:hypothetical protein
LRYGRRLVFPRIKEIVKKKDKFYGVSRALGDQAYEGKESLVTGNEQEVLNDFADWCAKRPSIMIAQKADYDLMMINTRLGRKVPNQGIYDTMLFTRYYLYPALAAASKWDKTAEALLNLVKDKKGKPSANLKNALSVLGISIQGWHGAMADVKSIVALYKGIYEHLKSAGQIYEDPTYKKTQEEAFIRTLGYKKKKQNP